MKAYAVILAFYILGLFLMPCADAHAAVPILPSAFDQSLSLQEQNHQHSDSHTDLCSPFCVCGCCGLVSGITLQWHSIKLDQPLSFDIFKPISLYRLNFTLAFVGKIWQPPKFTA